MRYACLGFPRSRSQDKDLNTCRKVIPGNAGRERACETGRGGSPQREPLGASCTLGACVEHTSESYRTC